MKKAAVPSVFGTVILLAVAVLAEAQQPKKIARIGYVSGSGDPKTPGPNVEAFRQGLRDLGYIEGKNILVEYRFMGGTVASIPSLVAELVELKVDMLVVPPLLAIRAAKEATKTIPLSWWLLLIRSRRG
jgi:putative ABC transport system substrate-binding protein